MIFLQLGCYRYTTCTLDVILINVYDLSARHDIIKLKLNCIRLNGKILVLLTLIEALKPLFIKIQIMVIY